MSFKFFDNSFCSFFLLAVEVFIVQILLILVYSFKYVDYAVDNGYLPLNLKSKYVPSDILGKGACGEVRLAYNKVRS